MVVLNIAHIQHSELTNLSPRKRPPPFREKFARWYCSFQRSILQTKLSYKHGFQGIYVIICVVMDCARAAHKHRPTCYAVRSYMITRVNLKTVPSRGILIISRFLARTRDAWVCLGTWAAAAAAWWAPFSTISSSALLSNTGTPFLQPVEGAILTGAAFRAISVKDQVTSHCSLLVLVLRFCISIVRWRYGTHCRGFFTCGQVDFSVSSNNFCDRISGANTYHWKLLECQTQLTLVDLFWSQTRHVARLVGSRSYVSQGRSRERYEEVGGGGVQPLPYWTE
jgi:hypothetical protein